MLVEHLLDLLLLLFGSRVAGENERLVDRTGGEAAVTGKELPGAFGDLVQVNAVFAAAGEAGVVR